MVSGSGVDTTLPSFPTGLTLGALLTCVLMSSAECGACVGVWPALCVCASGSRRESRTTHTVVMDGNEATLTKRHKAHR